MNVVIDGGWDADISTGAWTKGTGVTTINRTVQNIEGTVRNPRLVALEGNGISNFKLQDVKVREALLKIENPMLKLDAGLPELYQLINRPTISVTMKDTVEGLRAFNGNFVMQSMFLKGEIDGVKFDNTAEENVAAWLKVLQEVKPRKVVLYSLDRETPAKQLVKVHQPELEQIAVRVRALGIEAQVFE